MNVFLRIDDDLKNEFMTMTVERNDFPSQFARKHYDDCIEKSATYPQPLCIQSGARPRATRSQG